MTDTMRKTLEKIPMTDKNPTLTREDIERHLTENDDALSASNSKVYPPEVLAKQVAALKHALWLIHRPNADPDTNEVGLAQDYLRLLNLQGHGDLVPLCLELNRRLVLSEHRLQQYGEAKKTPQSIMMAAMEYVRELRRMEKKYNIAIHCDKELLALEEAIERLK